MKNIDFESRDQLIYTGQNETDHLSAFLKAYADETSEQPDSEKELTSEIKNGLRKLNEILEGLNFPENKNNLSDWMTSGQMKRALGVSERTLASWRKSGKLPFSPIEQIFFYKRRDVEYLLSSRYSKNDKQASQP